MTMDEPRDAATRRRDLLARLEDDKDAWVATASSAGEPCLVPLAFYWDGSFIYVATRSTNPTGRNIQATGKARLAVGHTRDVGSIDATAQELTSVDAEKRCAVAYASKSGWDPRQRKGYVFFALEPQRVEAWRELNELSDRVLMKDGEWRPDALDDRSGPAN